MAETVSFYDEMFMENIYIDYGTTKEDFVKKVKDKVGMCPDLEMNDGMMLVVESVEGDRIHWVWTGKPNVTLLSHELVHLMHFIMSNKGISLTDETDEVYAYYMSFLFGKIYGQFGQREEKEEV